MIHGETQHPLTVQLLRNAPYRFYLTGSRFFGNANSNSDWDYFVQNTNGLGTWLTQNGFVIEDSPDGYESIQTITAIYYKDSVHVQIVQSARAKLWVQDELKHMFKSFSVDKETRKRIWYMMLKSYTAGMQAKTHLELLKERD